MKFIIDKKLLLIFSFTFVLFTIIGTITHEYGHILVAKSLGYKTTLHFASIQYDQTVTKKKIDKLLAEKNISLTNNKEYKKIVKKSRSDALLIFFGGPLQTSLTGLAGLLILYYRRKKRTEIGFKFIDWLAVFLALFLLRSVFNLVMSVTGEIISPNGYYFGGDELYLAVLLKIWPGTISIIFGVIGLIVSLFVIFKIIHVRLRFTFIISGILGGISGFTLWMKFLGPRILP